MLLLKAASRAHCPANSGALQVEVGGRGLRAVRAVLFMGGADPTDQFFSFFSVGDFVNCANPSSADCTCAAYGPLGSNCKYLW